MKRILAVVLTIIMVVSLGACDNFFKRKLSAEKIYDIVSPATVELIIETDDGQSVGTGFFDDNNGTIITNYHVIERGKEGIAKVKNAGNFDIEKILGYDEELDIAILQIDYKNQSSLKKREDAISVGETVYALGSSEGLTDSFSSGIVSAVDRTINGNTFIQITTPISHGNSGGPLVDSSGNVVGITSAGIEEGQNLNLAIPIINIKKISRDKDWSFTQFYNLTDPERPAYEDISVFLGVLKGEHKGTVHLYTCEKVKNDYNRGIGETSDSVRDFPTVKKALEAGFKKDISCNCINKYWKDSYNMYQ